VGEGGVGKTALLHVRVPLYIIHIYIYIQVCGVACGGGVGIAFPSCCTVWLSGLLVDELHRFLSPRR